MGFGWWDYERVRLGLVNTCLLVDVSYTRLKRLAQHRHSLVGLSGRT